MLKRLKILIGIVALSIIVSTPQLLAEEKYTANECFEKFSRGTLKFNMALDRAIFKPVAKGYRALPVPIRKGSSNFIENLRSLLSFSNNVLQGDLKGAANTAGRFAVNTTVGILGVFDPATKMGLTKRSREDFGQTLGVWGADTGCYFVLPILGPTTARDAVGTVSYTHLTLPTTPYV